MKDARKAEIPKEIVKLNRAVEILAHLEYQDLEQVRRVVTGVRWEIAATNLALAELLVGEDVELGQAATAQTSLPFA